MIKGDFHGQVLRGNLSKRLGCSYGLAAYFNEEKV
jgi:hypothetical protein